MISSGELLSPAGSTCHQRRPGRCAVGRAGGLGDAAQPGHPGGGAHRAGPLQIERLHAAQSPPHSYLGYLGTRRDRQGQGLGTQMLAEVLAGADTDGMPAYLESSSERNLPLYERNGFRVVGELQALGHGPAIWRMWREPPPRT
jgi:GNAT superfamily N-acetyltransferase